MVISAGVTVAPVAGTSPEPQGAGSWGAVPHSCPPTLQCPRPTVLPLQPILSSSASPLSPKNETSFQSTLSLQRPAPVIPGSCPFRATLRFSSYPPDPLKFPSTTPPNTPEAPSARPPPPPGDAQAWRPSGGSPTLNPLHLLLGLRPDWPGLRLRRGAGRGVPQAAESRLADVG